MFSANDVKTLREKTGAGMLDCKNALKEANGDMEKAVDWLREKGIAKAAKKESRIAAEGTTRIVVEGNKAVVLEVNSETDFVAKNDEFKNFVDSLATVLVQSNAHTMEEALVLSMDGVSVQDKIVDVTAKIGEKISFRRFELLEKNENQVFGAYSHMGGKIGVLALLSGTTEEVAKEVAMHIAAMNPKYLDRSLVPAEELEREKNVMKEQLLNEGKPEDKIAGILVGKVNKYYADVCLVDQVFIKAENKETVGDYVKANGGEVLSMVRFEVGEGIEKRCEDFASEVMGQING